MSVRETRYIRWFANLSNTDVPLVGGKNASLGELVSTLKERNIRVPDGFATTSDAYWRFLEVNDLVTPIRHHLELFTHGRETLEDTGAAIRAAIAHADFPAEIADEIRCAYRELSQRYDRVDADVAVRSSATAEDLPSASFAGQQESYLNVRGEEDLLAACRLCYASLFTDRAITYRQAQGFDHLKIALSIGIQKMVRSDLAGSGVMFTIDTETGFPDAIIINAAWGLGETVVKGMVDPDEYIVFKPLLQRPELEPILEKKCGLKARKLVYASTSSERTVLQETPPDERRAYVLSNEEIMRLARWAVDIETHYGRPMDIEWAKDGETGDLFFVQARPETVQSRLVASSLKTYHLKQEGPVLVTGLAIGTAIAAGNAQIIRDPGDIERFQPGSVLVTEMTDPDWVPVMKRAVAIITDHGGRTSHAAIVSRELGVPALVGTETATSVLHDGQPVTLSCVQGEDGVVYDGILEFDETDIDLTDIPETRTHIMMNIANPAGVFRWWRLPARGVGLARMEFIINNAIKIHPMALVRFDALQNAEARRQIEEMTRGYDDKREYFIERLALGIAKIAAAEYPDPVVVRTSDFKTNEYADLIGGDEFELPEANPMLGFRGAARYYSDRYREGFALECEALRRVRETIGLSNVIVMIPFCRTLEEADKVLAVLAEYGLKRGEHGLKVYVMAEIPSNIVLAEEFARRFDGFSIGSNDLTQLTLGVDRDSVELASLFDERNEAVESLIADLIRRAHTMGVPVGICGQAPSDYPEFNDFLVEAGIDSISLNPDSVIGMVRRVAAAERAAVPGSDS